MRKIYVFYGLMIGVVFVFAILTAATFEAYLVYQDYERELGTTDRIRMNALKQGAKFDLREKVEVVRDLKNQGIDTQPVLAPQIFVESEGIQYNGKILFPFGGISNTTNVFCNEDGRWSIYKSDEFGFNNPLGAWQKQVDVAFIGDSFVHGACLQEGEDMASQVRKAGFNTVNVGIGGTGPLIYLSVLKEYIKPVKAKTVLWFHYAVDIRDHLYELQSQTLRKYLEDDSFSQNLVNRQQEIDSFLRGYFEVEYEKFLAELGEKKKNRRKIMLDRFISESFTFTRLRKRIDQLRGKDLVTEGRETEKIEALKKILIKAKTEVESWGGSFVFVWLPDWYTWGAERDSYGIIIDDNFLLRQEVLKLVRELNIPVVDIQAEVFEKHPDPLSLFNFRTYGHYTLEGYTKITSHLISYLNGKHFKDKIR